MLATNLNECSYMFRRGKLSGKQCCKQTYSGICCFCSNRLKDDTAINVLTENIHVNNEPMIIQCLNKFIYPYHQIFNIVSNHTSMKTLIIKTWMYSKSQNEFIQKYWLCKSFNLVNDVISVIHHMHYHIQYHTLLDQF